MKTNPNYNLAGVEVGDESKFGSIVSVEFGEESKFGFIA